ncbi:MAG: Nif3-like dinuclear metal center hexameric protein [Armatimonadota bacterium]|nr:Nif3-like dinuclear metal center hexameric protein [Armatimonadota bacterium]
MTLDDILRVLRQLAPEETALPDDPVGLLLGQKPETEIRKIGVCLDATPNTAQRAVALGAGLLVAHHPLIYHPLKRIAPDDPISQSVSTLIKGDVALYAMHTNWDRAENGINDTLAALLGLENIRPLGDDGAQSLPRLGDLPSPRALSDFARFVGTALHCKGTSALRVNAVDPAQRIARVAVCGGAGAFLAADVQAAGVDAYVTSDVRHHEFLEAAARGLALLDAGHGATETPGMQALLTLLPPLLPGVDVVWAGE